jgi:hypothetical protein
MFVIRNSLWIIMLLLFRMVGQSQPVHLWLDTASGCTGDTISIQLKTADFLQVGSLTLYITYNTNELQYDTTLLLHPALPGLLVNKINTGATAVAFAWFTGNLNPVNIGTGTLATLRFIKLADSALLNFGPQCEVTNPQGHPLAANYSPGMVTLWQIAVDQQPVDMTVVAGHPAQFTVGVSAPGVTYRWQSSTDGLFWVDLNDNLTFGGTYTHVLSLFQPDQTLHNTQFRCRLVLGHCIGYSSAAMLQIDTTQSIPLQNNPRVSLQPFPNPFSGTIIIPWFGLPLKTCTFALRDMSGKVVQAPQGSHISPTDAGLEISRLELKSGSYFIQLHFIDISNQEHHSAYLIMSK